MSAKIPSLLVSSDLDGTASAHAFWLRLHVSNNHFQMKEAAIQWLIATDQACCSYHDYMCIIELNVYSLSQLLNIQSFRK
jgi:hypothetical protein